MRLIDVDKLIKELEELSDSYIDYNCSDFTIGVRNICKQIGVDAAIEVVRKQKPIDTVKHGEWITVSPNYSEPDDWYCECSLCGCAETDTTQFLPNYCPNCGAKMDGYKPLDRTEDG